MHGGKELGEAGGQPLGRDLFVAHQPLEHAAGQQAHVFGKKAEQALREEMRDLVGALLAGGVGFARRGAALAQAFGQGGKALCGGFGDVAAGLVRLEALRRGPDAAQQGPFFWLVHLGNAHFVRLARVAGELGVHPNREPVRHHQNRRVAQGQAVGEELLEGGVEVFARRLVFQANTPRLNTSA